MKKNLLYSLIFTFVILFTGCKKDEPELEKPLQFTSFEFREADNPAVKDKNISYDIGNEKIEIFIEGLESAKWLRPSFKGEFEKVEVDNILQTSGYTVQDFDKIVTYTLYDKNGNTKSYDVEVKIFTALPVVWIETENRQPITSKEDYVRGTVTISLNPDTEERFEATMQIRGRGNATWLHYPKKPYRIKLDAKAEILGMPADRDWVLLADYCDKSMLRTTYGFELSKLAEISWTVRGYHVEVFLNGSYNGTYFMGEHVKVSKDRADIGDDGFLFENDNYWNEEPLWFRTELAKMYFTFKHPDLTAGDESYTFIKNFMDEFESVLYSANFADANTGYRKYIDVESFAKWYLVQEVLGNIEPNDYYALESRSAKLKMYPVWDLEWSMGLADWVNNAWVTPPATSPVEKLFQQKKYYSRLFEDPYFVGIVKTEWTKMKNNYLPELFKIMEKKTDNLKYAQKQNFKRWPILGQYISVGLVKFDTWEEETKYAKNFLEARIQWLDSEIQSW